MKKRPPPNLPVKYQKRPCPQPLNQDALERILMRQIFQPMEVVTKTEALVTRPHPSEITSETREGQFINKRGVLECVQQKRNYVRTLKDGTPVGENGYVRCQTCKAVVSTESIHRCPCGKTCCISKRCGCYVNKHDQWYCSKSHALLSMLKINLRWVT